MQRYFLELAYFGRDFVGWQKQPEGTTVQETIEDALTLLNSNIHVPVVGCGRTDTGVHAKNYTLHFDFKTIEDEAQFVYKLNKMLPDSIAIYSIRQVAIDAHARFDAKERVYRYFIHRSKDPFIAEQSLHIAKSLDFNLMNEAAQFLIGTKDFTSLSKLHTDVKTNICNVTDAKWVIVNDDTAYFEIKADRFLRNMVRATVGTLLEVGEGKIKPTEIISILEKMDRQAAATSAPAHGLFLWKVEY